MLNSFASICLRLRSLTLIRQLLIVLYISACLLSSSQAQELLVTPAGIPLPGGIKRPSSAANPSLDPDLSEVPVTIPRQISMTGIDNDGSARRVINSVNPLIQPDAALSGYHLTFDDEFNSVSASSDPYLLKTLWCLCSWWYPAPATNSMYVSGGILHMPTKKDASGNWNGSHLSTWSPTTRGFSQRFGYWETRVKFPGQLGILSDFYLISEKDILTDGVYPSAEVDIFEKPKGDTLFLTLHDGTAAGQWRWGQLSVPSDFDQNWHTIGALWDEDTGGIAWYLDGSLFWWEDKFNDTDLSPAIMTLETGVNGVFGAPDSTTANPSEFLVDYVRVYSKDPALPMWSLQQ